MKKILALLLISLSSAISAENSNEPDYEAIGAHFALYMQKIEACQSKVDKAKLERFKQQAELNSEKVETLCMDNRDKAEELEESFMEEAMKDPEIKAMMMCMSDTTDTASFGESDDEDDSEDTSHTCD